MHHNKGMQEGCVWTKRGCNRGSVRTTRGRNMGCVKGRQEDATRRMPRLCKACFHIDICTLVWFGLVIGTFFASGKCLCWQVRLCDPILSNPAQCNKPAAMTTHPPDTFDVHFEAFQPWNCDGPCIVHICIESVPARLKMAWNGWLCAHPGKLYPGAYFPCKQARGERDPGQKLIASAPPTSRGGSGGDQRQQLQ